MSNSKGKQGSRGLSSLDHMGDAVVRRRRASGRLDLRRMDVCTGSSCELVSLAGPPSWLVVLDHYDLRLDGGAWIQSHTRLDLRSCHERNGVARLIRMFEPSVRSAG
ncbi:hypothetical protein GCM10025868_27310 [Angustibacter aerolatus]|uniref:Uncharacterized protein n=1 Tax=Angustibacter aerolatus TaxID=1162965 RepID=A0ABQ6JIV9_9ACTN|nr:hypothetical protein GCM10025868_27310 [Angustibacter aerolatus]